MKTCMDMLTFDIFVSRYKCTTVNCTAGASLTPLLFTQCKKIEYSSLMFSNCSAVLLLQKTVQKYTGPCSESPSHPWNKGLLEESGVLCELLHHKGTETHELQEFISTICQAFVHFLQTEQTRENSLKMAMLKAAVSWGAVENKKFASCFRNQHRFLQQSHHAPLQLGWNNELSSLQLISYRRPPHDSSIHKGMWHWPCKPWPGASLQGIHTTCLAALTSAKPPPQLAFLLHQNGESELLLFGKAYFMHQNKNLHFAAPNYFLSADLFSS